MRCMLSKIMLAAPNFLLLDEPTNHLDLESITALNNGLEQFEGSIILASHDVQFVDTLVSRVIELDGEQYYDVGKGYEEYLQNSERKARALARAQEEQRRKQAKKAARAKARAEEKAKAKAEAAAKKEAAASS